MDEQALEYSTKLCPVCGDDVMAIDKWVRVYVKGMPLRVHIACAQTVLEYALRDKEVDHDSASEKGG